MADVAFSTQGNLGFLTKQENGALLRIGKALCGLVGSLISSLEEFRDLGNTLELEIAAGIVDGSPDESQTNMALEARPQLLVLANALKEMVGTLVSDIKGNAEVQKLLPAIQKARGGNQDALHDLFQDLTISRHPSDDLPSCLVDISPRSVEMPVCISGKDLSRGKRAAGKGQRICKHSCEEHPELVDPGLWKKLPQELVEMVFAKLPLPSIFKFCESSKVNWIQLAPTWLAMSKSSNFREACTEGHPELFGLVVCDPEFGFGSPHIRIHDTKSKEWLWFDLVGLPRDYGTNYLKHDPGVYIAEGCFYGCDGGLACFVRMERFTSNPVLVCNPLTGIWKALPVPPLEDFEKKEVVIVQLLMEGDQKCYRVIVVSGDKVGKAYAAHVYNPKTGVWSIMDSGLVYGLDSDMKYGRGVPYVFDCSTKELVDLSSCHSLTSLDGISNYSVAKDRVFVLHESEVRGQRDHYMYLVSEYTWDSSISDLKVLNISESPVSIWPDPYRTLLFASPSSVLVFADHCDPGHEDHHQLIGRYDVSAKQWDIPPPVPFGDNILYQQLQQSFMCELRWNVSP